MTQYQEHNRAEEICQISRAFLSHVEELRSTLEVVQASLEQAINQSSLSPKEREVLKHITSRVAPVGLRSLLEGFELTAARTSHLRTETYKELAAALASTIYEQAGVAGPTGERTFNNRYDAMTAATKEVAKPRVVTVPPKVIIPVRTATDAAQQGCPATDAPGISSINAKAKYNQYIKEYPILGFLTRKPKEPPSEIHAWLRACGYEMTDNLSAQATLGKGLDALLWPADEGVNAVVGVHVLPHPSRSGEVYILTMEKDTCGKESGHLLGIECATWCSPEYPKYIVVEVSTKLSKDSPLKQKRRGWEEVEAYLNRSNPQGNQVPHTRGNHGENSRTRNSSSIINTAKQHPTTI